VDLTCPHGQRLSGPRHICTRGAPCSVLGPAYLESEVTTGVHCDGGYWEVLTDRACAACQPAMTPPPPPPPPAITTSATTTSATTTSATTVSAAATAAPGGAAAVGVRGWELVGGPWNRACRGADAGDDSPAYYDLHTGVSTLEACKTRCLEAGLRCRGVEHNPRFGRCEVWHREAGIYAFAEPREPGFTCARYGWPAKWLLPVDGAVDRACRGDSVADDSGAYYTVERAVHMEDCRARCVHAPTCLGIEFSPRLGRCEIWTRTVGASAPRSGFTCLRFQPPAPALAARTAAETLYP